MSQTSLKKNKASFAMFPNPFLLGRLPKSKFQQKQTAQTTSHVSQMRVQQQVFLQAHMSRIHPKEISRGHFALIPMSLQLLTWKCINSCLSNRCSDPGKEISASGAGRSVLSCFMCRPYDHRTWLECRVVEKFD